MDIEKWNDPLELVIREFSDKIQIHGLKNGNKTLPINGDKSFVIDLSSKTIIPALNFDLKLLVQLDLSRCDLTYFPSAFELDYLKELNLSHNNLSEVPPIVFQSLNLLQHLDLSYNQIDQFNGLPMCSINLCMLRLNNNRLKNIPECVLKLGFLNLQEFYYSYNEIYSFETSRFLYGGPYRLKKLELKNCLVQKQDIKFIKHIRTLRELDLSNEDTKNRNNFDFLETFCDGAMWDDQLFVLKLNNLSIPDVPLTISKLINLKELHISKNNLMWLPDSICLLEDLTVLDVSNNQLFSLPNNIDKLKKIEIIKAASNNISELPDLSFLNINYLDLYKNSLNECCIVNWNTMHYIDLEYNYFDTCYINDYNGKKSALRETIKISREDGINEFKDDSPSEDDDNSIVSYDSSSSNGINGEFGPEISEECWDSAEDCDNSCTASDNEWTGVETVVKQRKKVKQCIEISPSWMFEDAD